MKKCLGILLLLVVRNILLADGIEKGFERLKVYDYFSAKNYFEKALKSKPVGAAYGLSLIFASGDNPFYNLDSARVYILLADSALTVSSLKQIYSYTELGVTKLALSIQRDTICSRAYEKAIQLFTVKDLNAYIKNFKFCSTYHDAITKRNKAAFMDARAINSSNAYEEFMLIYPLADEFNQARVLYDERIFEELTRDKTVASYRQYLVKYPDGPFKQEAERMIYEISTAHHTLDEFDLFIKQNSASYYFNDAWRNLYKLFFKEFTNDNYQAFLKAYPGYPFMEELNEDFKLMNSQLLPFQKGEFWGYINEDGKEIIKPVFEETGMFTEGLASVKQNGRYGFINKSGKVIIPFVFEETESFKNKTVVVSSNGKFGLISQSGDTLIPLQYDDLSDPVEDICIALVDEQSGYISKTGKKITDFIYDFAGEFKDGYAVVGKDEKYGLIRKNGITLVDLKYEQVLPIHHGLFRVRLNSKWGIISGMGEVVVPLIYSMISDFSEGKALVVRNGKCGFINEAGKVVVPLNFVYSENLMNTALYKNNFVLLKQKSKSVVLDSAGNKILFANFEDFGLPAEGLIPVRKLKKWGYATVNGKIKILCKYQEAGSFEGEFAKVVIKNLTGIIDTSGKVILPVKYQDILIKPGCFITRINNLLGIQSVTGTPLLPNEFDKINILSDKTAEAIKGDKKMYVNFISGKVIFQDN